MVWILKTIRTDDFSILTALSTSYDTIGVFKRARLGAYKIVEVRRSKRVARAFISSLVRQL